MVCNAFSDIGVKCQFLSDGNLVIHVGYIFDKFLSTGGNISGPFDPQGWEERGDALNGAPSCDELVNRLVAGLKSNLPTALDQFARFFEEGLK